MFRISSRTQKPGFVDTGKSKSPMFDPGLKNATNGQFTFENTDVLPDEITGVALGFEQRDAVVEIKGRDEDGGLRTEMYIFYAYDNSIVHAYAGEESKTRGYNYQEIQQSKLYDILGISSGVMRESLRWLGQTAVDTFSKRPPRRSLVHVHNGVRRYANQLVEPTVTWYVTRLMLDQTVKAIASMSAEGRVVAKNEVLELVERGIFKRSRDKEYINVELDKDGSLVKFFQTLSPIIGETARANVSKALRDRATRLAKDGQSDFGKLKESKDVMRYAVAFDGGGEFPKNVEVQTDENEMYVPTDPDYDAKACAYIYNTFNGKTQEEKADIVRLIRSSKLAYNRKDDARMIGGIESILSMVMDDKNNMLANPINTEREVVNVSLDNAEAVSSMIQGLYDTADFASKEKFAEVVTSRASGTGRIAADIAVLYKRLASEEKSQNLSNIPVRGSELVVEPNIAFFDTVSKLGELREKTEGRIHSSEQPDPEDLRYLEYIDIVERIAARANISDKIISAKVGGWLSVYSPAIDEVVLYDTSVMNRENGLKLYENFSKESHAKKIQELIYKLQNSITKGKPYPLSKMDLINAGLSKESVEQIAAQAPAAQLESLYDVIIDFGRELVRELAKIDGVNENIGSGKDLERIINGFESMSMAERPKESIRLFQSLLMSEKGVKHATTKQLTKPQIAEKTNRPSVRGGLPRWIAGALGPKEKSWTSARDIAYRLPDKEHFVGVTFRKQTDISNIDPKKGVGIKGDVCYVIDSVVANNNFAPMPATKTFVERMASSIQVLNRANELGIIAVAEIEGQTQDPKLINLAKIIEYMAKTIEDYKASAKSNGKDLFIDELNKILAGSKTAFEHARLSGDSEEACVAKGMAIIKEQLFGSENNDVKLFVSAALGVNADNVESSISRYIVSRQVRNEVKEFVGDMVGAINTGSSENLMYIPLDKTRYNDEEKYRKALKTLAGLQFSIARKIAITQDAITTLEERGEKVAKESNTTVRDGANPVRFAPEVSEAHSTLFVLRNQEHMANISGTKNNYIWHNANSRYTKWRDADNLKGEYLPTVEVVPDFREQMVAALKEYTEKRPAEQAVKLLEEGLENNKPKATVTSKNAISLLMQLDESPAEVPSELAQAQEVVTTDISFADIIADERFSMESGLTEEGVETAQEQSAVSAPAIDEAEEAFPEPVTAVTEISEPSLEEAEAAFPEPTAAPRQSLIEYDDIYDDDEEEMDEEIDFADLSMFVQDKSGAFDDMTIRYEEYEDRDIYSGLKP